jgi:ribosome-binding protein aMBF1 (putative translation factor)
MSPTKTTILNDAQIKAIAEIVHNTLPGLKNMGEDFGIEFDIAIRLVSLCAKCTEAREKLGLSIKDVAKLLAVPQYRIRDIEARTRSKIEPPTLARYIALLGIERWVAKWVAANPELAEELGLAATRQRAEPAKKKAPRKKTRTRRRAKAAPKSNLDLDYEEYLELYTEDNDGGKRPKLTRHKFAELSDEMMDLVTRESIEKLPPERKRRRKELEYLLIA